MSNIKVGDVVEVITLVVWNIVMEVSEKYYPNAKKRGKK